MTGAHRTISLNGRSIAVTENHADFWDRCATNAWEPETFEVFDHFIGPETFYIDVGCWIGPTLLYAATRARYAAGFEPDPVAYSILSKNVAANPNLANIEIHGIAITSKSGTLRMGSQGSKGDSMSSALFADMAECWTAEARRLDDITADLPDTGDCFVKVDVEGGEYWTLASMEDALVRRRATVFISLHQKFLMAPYLGRGIIWKAIGECLLFIRSARFIPLLLKYPFIYRERGVRLTALGFLHRNNWRRAETLLLSFKPWHNGPANTQ